MSAAAELLVSLLLALLATMLLATTRALALVARQHCHHHLRATTRRLAMAADGGVELPPLLFEAQEYFAQRGVELGHTSAALAGSRTTSRLAVRADASGAAVVGMFKPNSHDVMPCHLDERCHQPHHPAINAAVATLDRELVAFGELSAYDEAAARGTLRYIQLSVERSSGRVQLTLVANAETLDADPALRAFAARLWAAHRGGDDGVALHSIWVNLNPTRVNNILSYADGAWQLLHSADDSADSDDGAAGELDQATSAAAAGCLVEAFPSGASFVLPPYVFRQANLDAFDAIVATTRAAVPQGARLVEWYAGVGVLGLSLAADAEWVRCSDVNPPREAFAASRALLPPAAQPRISYSVGSAAERIEDARGADAAVVDPPRKGLDAGLLEALCESGDDGACAGLRTLVYISCGFPALARDADVLLEAGWAVRDDTAHAHILFPGANHIETVVVFERGGGDDAAPEPEPLQATAPAPKPQAAAKRAGASSPGPRARRLAANKRRSRGR